MAFNTPTFLSQGSYEECASLFHYFYQVKIYVKTDTAYKDYNSNSSVLSMWRHASDPRCRYKFFTRKMKECVPMNFLNSHDHFPVFIISSRTKCTLSLGIGPRTLCTRIGNNASVRELRSYILSNRKNKNTDYIRWTYSIRICIGYTQVSAQYFYTIEA